MPLELLLHHGLLPADSVIALAASSRSPVTLLGGPPRPMLMGMKATG